MRDSRWRGCACANTWPREGVRSPVKDAQFIILQTAADRLRFDATTGRLVSLAPVADAREELIASAEDHPVFVVQYLDERRQYRALDSFGARKPRISVRDEGDERTLTMEFRRIGGLDVALTATVRASRRETLSRWTFELHNGAGLEVVDVQFPFVVAAYAGGRHAGTGAVLYPWGTGSLIRNPTPQALGPDHLGAWRFQPQQGRQQPLSRRPVRAVPGLLP